MGEKGFWIDFEESKELIGALQAATVCTVSLRHDIEPVAYLSFVLPHAHILSEGFHSNAIYVNEVGVLGINKALAEEFHKKYGRTVIDELSVHFAAFHREHQKCDIVYGEGIPKDFARPEHVKIKPVLKPPEALMKLKLPYMKPLVHRAGVAEKGSYMLREAEKKAREARERRLKLGHKKPR